MCSEIYCVVTESLLILHAMDCNIICSDEILQCDLEEIRNCSDLCSILFPPTQPHMWCGEADQDDGDAGGAGATTHNSAPFPQLSI